MTREQNLREQARLELARRSFAHYLTLTGGESYRETRFSRFLAETLQHFIETETGNAYDILLLEAPPQHGKSTAVTEALPSWCMGKYPRWRVILASYNDESAERFARRNRDKVERFGKELFGISLGDINRATEFELASGGRLISRGILAGITGNSANLLLIDDPIKNRTEADSEARRNQLWGEWLNSLKSRLAAGAKVVVVMTAWHEDDLAGRILSREKNVTLVRLPVEAERGDPMGRKAGEALCPELGKDKKWLRQFKASYLADSDGGARAWAALYQCSPRVEDGNMVKRSWWRFYKKEDVPGFATSVISVDAAFKGEERNDFVAIEVWGKQGNDYYLRHVVNRHMGFPETLAAIRTVRGLFPDARAVLIEDKANGSAIIQMLQKEMFCIPVEPRGGKVARVNAVTAAIESGHVFLPRGERFVSAFVDQFTAFPAGKNDDMVDSATQALSYLLHASGEAAQITVTKKGGEDEGELAEAMLDGETLFDVYGGGY